MTNRLTALKMTLFCFGAFVFLMATASAKNLENKLQFENPRIFAPLKGTNVTAAYTKILNFSEKDILLSVVGGDGFKAAELHESYEQGAQMRMKKIESIVVPAKGSIELKPGGNHIMLFDATKVLKEGDSLLLQFKTQEAAMSISFKIIPRIVTEEHQHH